jgi:hypothetical protein
MTTPKNRTKTGNKPPRRSKAQPSKTGPKQVLDRGLEDFIAALQMPPPPAQLTEADYARVRAILSILQRHAPAELARLLRKGGLELVDAGGGKPEIRRIEPAP